MPEVTSADQATEIAMAALQKGHGYPFARPVKAVMQDTVWIVEIDVGVFRPRIARVKINALNGIVLEYEVGEDSP